MPKLRVIRQGENQDSPIVDYVEVDQVLASRLANEADDLLRKNWSITPFVAVHTTDRYSGSTVRWWTIYHGFLAETNISLEEFERQFLIFTEGKPVLCIEVQVQRHIYRVYVPQTDPIDAINTFTVMDVLLS